MATLPDSSPNPSSMAYAEREQALQQRVSEAARALQGQGITPTVARIRAARRLA